jgi:hypothetical protein
MVEQVVENEQARTVLADLEAKATAARKAARDQEAIVEAGEKKLNGLAMDMVAIEQGKFVPPMFDDQGEALALPGEPQQAAATAGPDPAATTPLKALLISESKLEKLLGSQLAAERKLETIADLERAMQSDPLWSQKIKGVGPSGIDGIVDALVKWRSTHPVPGDADGRVKQCIYEECQQHDSAGIFDPELDQCPVCGGKFFELVDRSDIFTGDGNDEPDDSDLDEGE